MTTQDLKEVPQFGTGQKWSFGVGSFAQWFSCV